MAAKHSTCKFCGTAYIATNAVNLHCSYQCRFKDIAAPFFGIKGCWEWPLSRNVQTGYGQFRISGKQLTAHRVSFALYKGDIPPGLCVCHTCDNPGCFNPAHLFTGTHRENMGDMIAKGRDWRGVPRRGAAHHMFGRSMRGSENGNAKIDEVTARAIKAAEGSMASIARHFSVPYGTVTAIKYGKTWKHLWSHAASQSLQQ